MPAKEAIEVDTRKLRQEAITENKTCISKLTNASSKISGINKYINQKASEFENIQGSGLVWGDKY